MRVALAELSRASGARVLDRSSVEGSDRAEVWSFQQLVGRMVELSAGRAPAGLTAAFGLVAEAQIAGDRAAWVTLAASTFFAPDAAAGGIDLAALPVVRAPDAARAARAADYLVRSDSFGLVVIDLAGEAVSSRAILPVPALTRLSGLARAHEAAVVFLTRKAREAASLNSLISLRAEATRARTGIASDVAVEVLKDKRGGPGGRRVEGCRGTVGVR